MLLILLLSLFVTILSIDRKLATITTYGTIDYSCLQTNSWVTGSTYYNSIFGKITDIINITYVSATSDFKIGYYGIPNYGRIFDSSIMTALANHKSIKAIDFEYPKIGTTASLGQVYEFGADIGYAMTKGSCLGYWPPGPSCPGISFKTQLVSLLPSPETQSKGCYALSGAQGTWVNGVLIYVWGDGNTYESSGVWSQLAMEFEKYAMDVCTGHAAGSAGYYHHHSYSQCLASQLQDDGTKHSPIYGWVNDGYPIYGPYQSNGVLASSCWQKRDYSSTTTGCSDGKRSCVFVDEYDYTKGTTTATSNGPDPSGTTTSTSITISAASGIYYQDYYYNSTCGNLGGSHLNSYNGHDHDDLGFHYHVTIDSSGNNVFPYTFGPKFYGCTEGTCCTSIKGDNTCKSASKSTCSSVTQGITLLNAQCLSGISTETWKPTAAPTNSPSTSKPSTNNPTVKPTFKPTGPSYSPTLKPSNPTSIPTTMPTTPTFSPTVAPTLLPTFNPSIAPTYLPTNPTVAPSKFRPTGAPSYTPTKNPTTIPTQVPSSLPSAKPSTGLPTLIQGSPTLTPSSTNPSIRPTLAPTMLPSSAIPTNTNSPTYIPTTISPSTTYPTMKPSTMNPTMSPTFIPSTIKPTNSPTYMPSTVRPTKIPSPVPSTEIPSNLPTLVPTFNPSQEPTLAPIIGTKTGITFALDIKFTNITLAVVKTPQFTTDFTNAVSNILMDQNIPLSEMQIARSSNSSSLINIRILKKSNLVNSNIVGSSTDFAIVYITIMIILENTIYSSSNSLQNALENIISSSCSNGDMLSYLGNYDITTLSSSPVSISSETILNDDDIDNIHPNDLSLIFLVVIVIISLASCAIISYIYRKWKKSFATNLDQLDTTNSDIRPSMYDDYSTNMLSVKVSNPITPRNGKNIDNSTEDDVRPSNFDVDEVYFDSNNVQQRPLSKNDLYSQYTKNISNSKSKVSEGHNSSVISRGIFIDRNKASQGDNRSQLLSKGGLSSKVSTNSETDDSVDNYRPSNFEIGAVYGGGGGDDANSSFFNRLSNISRGLSSKLRPKSNHNASNNTGSVIYDTSVGSSFGNNNI